jgi:aerobic-type carbon monoxide dehydrogenase small subunit (CoxS/CutS family)
MSDTVKGTVRVNGNPTDVEAPVDEVLLTTLRGMGLNSVRGTCGIGLCGTCTVLVDGQAVSACLTLTAGADGREVTTAEGLMRSEGEPGIVQQAFLDNDAFQCSYCIPAMTVMVEAYFREHENPSVEGAREYLQGNLCRCGTYPEILAAVAALVEAQRTAPS